MDMGDALREQNRGHPAELSKNSFYCKVKDFLLFVCMIHNWHAIDCRSLCIVFIFTISKWEVLFSSSCFSPILDIEYFAWGQMYNSPKDMRPWGATLRPSQDDCESLKDLELNTGCTWDTCISIVLLYERHEYIFICVWYAGGMQVEDLF